MNKQQKEIQQVYLNNEQKVLGDLKKVYKKSLDDIDGKIAELLGRNDTENLQSIIYQVEYQKALKKQISGILDTMNTEQFSSVSEYLTKCYEDGFVGVMYDLQGQGIPLIMPIDQEQVQKALVHDTKLSKSLYTKLGEDTEVLKRRIGANLSRGIAQGQSYAQIAKNIKGEGSIALNKTMRITRTEGHRITQESTYDAQIKAKDAGADVVKQWDATIDRRTRSHHAQLDGQIREIDEPFEINGRKAMYPGGFGVPSEDIHCRCVSLQRAKWALDDDELETLKNRAEAFGLDKTKDFKDFKEKYLQSVKDLEKNQAQNKGGTNPQLELGDFPAAFSSTPTKKKQTKKFIDYINGNPNADPEVVQLYKNMGKMDTVESRGIPFDIAYTKKNHAVSTRGSRLTNEYTEVKVSVPKLDTDDITGAIGTTAHEFGHLIDSYGRTDMYSWSTTNFTQLQDAIKNSTSDISPEVKAMFDDFKKDYDDIHEKYKKWYDAEYAKLKQQDVWQMTSQKYKEYKKKYNALWKERYELADEEVRNTAKGIDNLQDIYDALSGGKFRDDGTVLYGHGSKYFSKEENKAMEIWANYCSLSVTHPELIEKLNQDKPELVEALKELVKKLNGGV